MKFSQEPHKINLELTPKLFNETEADTVWARTLKTTAIPHYLLHLLQKKGRIKFPASV